MEYKENHQGFSKLENPIGLVDLIDITIQTNAEYIFF